MNYEVSWHDDDHTTLMARFDMGWTLQELGQSIEDIKTMIDAEGASHPAYYVISDMRSGYIPRNATAAHNVRLIQNHHEKLFS